MLGILTFLDPPRPDTKETIENAGKLGVEVRGGDGGGDGDGHSGGGDSGGGRDSGPIHPPNPPAVFPRPSLPPCISRARARSSVPSRKWMPTDGFDP